MAEPWYAEADCALYHADSKRGLAQYAPSCGVDLVLTDPPFGIGYQYSGAYKDDAEGYIEWLWPVIEEAESLLNAGGYVVVWQAAKNAPRWGRWFPREFRVIAILQPAGTMFTVDIQWRTEYALFWRCGKARPHAEVFEWQIPGARDWFLSRDASGGKRGAERRHPCPRPLDAVMYVVGCLCPPGGVVLDPFLGSGTTALAARLLGRRCVGVEVEECYLEIARERLMQRVLPMHQSPLVEQGVLW